MKSLFITTLFITTLIILIIVATSTNDIQGIHF